MIIGPQDHQYKEIIDNLNHDEGLEIQVLKEHLIFV